MIDRLEILEAQPLGEFASIDLVTLVALFEQWDLAWAGANGIYVLCGASDVVYSRFMVERLQP